MHPCFTDASDFRAFGPPETTVELPGDLALGLVIPRPFGNGTDAILTIHAKTGNGNDGGEITLAITNSVEVVHRPLDVPQQSNPRRYVDVDYWREEGA